jgi:hypothetical protein
MYTSKIMFFWQFSAKIGDFRGWVLTIFGDFCGWMLGWETTFRCYNPQTPDFRQS